MYTFRKGHEREKDSGSGERERERERGREREGERERASKVVLYPPRGDKKVSFPLHSSPTFMQFLYAIEFLVLHVHLWILHVYAVEFLVYPDYNNILIIIMALIHMYIYR